MYFIGPHNQIKILFSFSYVFFDAKTVGFIQVILNEVVVVHSQQIERYF